MTVIIELVVSFAQYLCNIVNIPEINFPPEWKVPIEYVATINIGLSTFASWFPALSDIRVYFLFLSVVGPMAFVMAGLLFLNEKRHVLWYLLVVLGVMLLLAGVLGRIIAATTSLPITTDVSQLMIYAGIAILFAMAVIFVIYKRCSKEDDEQVVKKAKVMDEETKTVHVFATVQSLLFTIGFAAFGVLCLGFITDVISNRIDTALGERFAKGLAGLSFLFSSVFFVWFVMGLSQGGRMKQWQLQSWFESSFLRVFLLTMSLSYIPIGGGVFLMFNCNYFTCSSGSRLPDDGSSIFSNTTSLSSGDYCVPCTLAATQQCPVALQRSMCNNSMGSRLEYSIATECSNVRSFFWPAAGLVIVMFVLGVPALFYHLIEVSSSILAKEFPVKEIKKPDDDPSFDPETAKWKVQVTQSQNVAKFLFQPFQFRFRFVRLLLIIQKLLIVGTTSYVIRGTFQNPQIVAVGCSTLIHFVSFVTLSYYRPFASAFEARIAIVMSLCLTGSCVITILLLQGVTIHRYVMIAIIALNGLIPVVSVAIGLYLEWTKGKMDDEEKEKEEMMRMSEEVNKKLEEEHRQEEEAKAAALAAILAQQEAAAARAEGGAPTDSVIEVVAGKAPLNLLVAPHNADPLEMSSSRMDKSMSKGLSLPPPRETAEERRRRQLKRLRLRQEAKLKVKDDLEQEAVRLNEAQGDVDLHIDRTVKAKLQMFLMIGGVIGAVALGLSVLGIITKEATSVLEPFPVTHDITTELASYTSWAQFTAACCCTTNTNPIQGGKYRLIEKWICTNGKIKERVRAMLSGNTTVDGFGVRSYCGMSFASDCGLVVNNATKATFLSCINTRTADELKLW